MRSLRHSRIRATFCLLKSRQLLEINWRLLLWSQTIIQSWDTVQSDPAEWETEADKRVELKSDKGTPVCLTQKSLSKNRNI